MIEFQLTVYMCSHCTRVHNAAQDCVHHELEEHSTSLTASFTAENVEQSTTSPSTDQPFSIVDDDVKPDTEDSFIQRYGDRQPENQAPIESQVVIKNQEIVKNQSLEKSAMIVGDEADRPPTLHSPRRSRKRTMSASSTSSDDSSKNSETVSSTARSRPSISCKICGLVSF